MSIPAASIVDMMNGRPGRKYSVLFTDGYIGTITKEHGLVRSMPKVKDTVWVKRFGGNTAVVLEAAECIYCVKVMGDGWSVLSNP